MSQIDRAQLLSLLALAEDQDQTAQVRGKAYEDVVDFLFSQIPGCRTQRNSLNEFKSEEVDLSVGNFRREDGLRMFPEVFLIECKNWSRPVDSGTVAFFAAKVRHRGCNLGILVAASGATGDDYALTAAKQQAAISLAEGIKLLLVTTNDFRDCNSIEAFIELLHRRFLDLHAAGTFTLA